jgi:hypothetical protein
MSKAAWFFHRVVLLAAFCAVVVVTSCSRHQPPPAAPESSSQGLSGELQFSWKAVAVLKTGENALWFELAEDGPRLVPSPGEAALAPYTPWPLSRFIAGMLPWDGSLVLAVNRDGFLILSPLAEGGVVLYRAADPAQWAAYTISSFFIYEDHPTALLYRDTFFSDPSVPPPEPPFFILSRDSPAPIAAGLPILSSRPTATEDNSAPAGAVGWELNSLGLGRDGLWYGRWAQTGIPRPGVVYFRAKDLSPPVETISLGEYRNSGLPEPVSAAPPFVADFLTILAAESSFPSEGEHQAAPSAGFSGQLAVEIVSPEFSTARNFSPGPGVQAGTENITLLRGYYRESPEPLVFAIDSNGMGFGRNNNETVFRFSLPPLPEGFVYTGVSLAGEILIASWEEQEDVGVGAAGFMVVDAGAFGFSGKE